MPFEQQIPLGGRKPSTIKGGFGFKTSGGTMRKAIFITLLANLAFWGWFWTDLAIRLRPIPTNGFDDVTPTPAYLFGNKCIPPLPIPYLSIPFRAQTIVQLPSLLAARLIQWTLFPSRFDTSRIAGISLAAWRLIVTTCLSFLQWYLICWIIHRLWRKWSGQPTAFPGRAPSTTTTR